jgi:acetyl/propionyl-CoA carboxylase alpha subunit/acetyl-CoA carboxylase carboxyltransferase component
MTQPGSFNKVFIANRGEVAVRIARAAAMLGIRSVAAFSRDDSDSLHRRRTDEAVALEGIGPAAYLDIEAIVAAAQSAGCDAIHPGYGFLSENAPFARRCAGAGLAFIGPRPEVLDLFGDKGAARRLAAELGVPLCRGTTQAVTLEEASDFLRSLGTGGKMMIKAIHGGGGRGMRMVESAQELAQAYAAARSEAKAAFDHDGVYVEELISPARHVEVQIVGDWQGGVTHLYERECSLQRRHQKLVEFAPSPSLSSSVRDGLTKAAVALAEASQVHTLCTFEFLVTAAGHFYFMEANPRLQVEHTVTEEVLGIDLVMTQFRLAAGASLESLRLCQANVEPPRGMAVQLRINMEQIDELGRAIPCCGTLRVFDPPGGSGIRLDTFARAGYTAPATFDSLLAKLIVHTVSGRFEDLLAAAYHALCEFRIEGVATNIGFLQNLLCHPEVLAGRFDTRFVEMHARELASDKLFHPALFDVGSMTPNSDAPLVDKAVMGPEGAVVVVGPMGGRLVRWAVEAGEAVLIGQVMAVIESMKMEHQVYALESGRVIELLVDNGDAVMAGQALLFLRPGEFGEMAGDLFAVSDGLANNQEPDELRERKAALLDAQRPEAVARQRSRAALTARERIARLCDVGSFAELGGLVQTENAAFAPADGLVMGSARIDGRPVMVLSQDFTVFGGSSGPIGKAKILLALGRCRTNGIPLVMMLDGGGHRIQDGQNSRYYAWANPVFQEFARLSGWVPIVAAVLGMGYAANTNFCAMADHVTMVRGLSEMGLAGPALVKAGTGEQITGQRLGGADIQVDRYGMADLGVGSEDEAFAAICRFLSFLPSNAGLPTPRTSFEAGDTEVLNRLVPSSSRQTYDTRRVIEHIADAGSLFEIKSTYGANLVTCMARMGGQSVGFIANQPLVKGGMIDSAASEKGAHFIALCDAYGLPLIYLIDVPGVSIGSEAERTVLGRRSAKLLFELGHATVPRMSVVIRKGYGLGYVAMCGGRGFEPDACVAWPTAEICAMSIEGSVDVAYRKKFQDAPDPTARRQEIIDEIRARVSALQAAEGFGIDDVIEPSQTRAYLLNVLAQAPPRRQSTMPAKWRSISPI